MTRPAALVAVPFHQLVLVELRKSVDTRSGRAMLAALAALIVAVVVVLFGWGERADRAFTNLLLVTQLPIGLLLPAVAVTAVTGEWSTRCTLTTFTLVPQRMRAVAAKVVALILLSQLLVAGCVLIATGSALVGSAPADPLPQGPPVIVRAALFQLACVLVGLGLGLFFLRAAISIVAWFLLPTVVSTVSSSIHPLRAAEQWLDLTLTTTRLLGDPMTGRAWAQLGVSLAVWGLVPLALGALRVQRSDVR